MIEHGTTGYQAVKWQRSLVAEKFLMSFEFLLLQMNSNVLTCQKVAVVICVR